MTQWVRLWEDMPDDPKWRVIARRSGRPLHQVVAVFTRMLVNASRSSARGTLEGWEDEDEAVALDMDEADVAAIRNAMQGKVLDGDALSGWEKRQPKREDASTDRVKAFRERQNAMKRDETHRNAPEEKRGETEKKELGEADASLVDADAVDPPADGSNVIKIERKAAAAAAKKSDAVRAAGEWWNEVAAGLGLSQIEAIRSGSTREAHAWARCRELASEHEGLSAGLSALSSRIHESSFLTGRSKDFRASFDWVMNASNFQKIMEGNYADRKTGRSV